jgi:predicted ATPase
VLYGLFVVRWNRAELASAVEVARELLERALHASAHDPAPECVARRALAVAYNVMGEFVTAREQASKAALLYDGTAHRRSAVAYGHDIGVAALMHRAVADLFLGDFGAAKATAREAASLARTLGHANTIGYAEMWSGFMQLSARQVAAAQRSTERLLRVGEEGGMPQWAAFGRCLKSGVEAVAGPDPTTAVELLDNGIGECERRRIRILRPVFLCLRAQGLGRIGRFDEALSSIDEAMATAEQTGERWWNAEFLRIRAQLLLARDGSSAERAEDDLTRAIIVAEQQQARMLQLRAATRLARLWCAVGKRKEALNLLPPIYRWFDPEGDAPDLTQAASVLREVRAA